MSYTRANEIHVWRVQLTDDDWPPVEGLPAEDRLRASAFQSLGWPSLSAARGARWGPGREAGGIELAVSEHGKPRLVDPGATLRSNLNQSGELALIAVVHDFGTRHPCSRTWRHEVQTCGLWRVSETGCCGTATSCSARSFACAAVVFAAYYAVAVLVFCAP